MFVVDFSNSMWGQIDGTAKVEIAKKAFSGFVDTLPEGSQAGLMTYGHRRKSDCGDVETLIAVSPLNREKMKSAITTLKPRGKTPITDALRMAAKDLGINDRPSRLVLISDGIETCGGDPCALAAELAKTGVDFKAHVIGFDIASKADQAKIACIAHLTGGKYWNAEDADGLAEALKQTAEVEQTDVADEGIYELVLTAVDKESGNQIDGDVNWVISQAEDESIIASGLTGGQVSFKLPEGDYVVTAEFGEKVGGASFTVTDQGAKQSVELAGELPEATVSPKETEVVAGSSVEVAFTGPLAESDFLRITTPDGKRLERDLWTAVKDGSPARLDLPSEEGDYEVAYVWTEFGERVLAKAALKVGPAAIKLTYPAEVVAGSMVEIAFDQTLGAEDWIGIVPKGGTIDDYGNRWKGTVDGSPVSIQAPTEPGAYEVIYVAGVDQGILTRQPLSVTEAEALVSSAPQVEAGGRIDVTWKGPAEADDWIGVSLPGSEPEAYVTYERPSGESVALLAPVTPGSYELRYILSAADGAKVLASQPIEITEVQVSIEGPSTIAAGSTFDVKVSGPANGSNWVGLAIAGDGASGYVSGAWETIDNIAGGVVTLTAPNEPGNYELRFVLSGVETVVAASQPVTVN